MPDHQLLIMYDEQGMYKPERTPRPLFSAPQRAAGEHLPAASQARPWDVRWIPGGLYPARPETPRDRASLLTAFAPSGKT